MLLFRRENFTGSIKHALWPLKGLLEARYFLLNARQLALEVVKLKDLECQLLVLGNLLCGDELMDLFDVLNL